MCEPASHASHNATHVSRVSQGASHVSHRFHINQEYQYVTAANTVQIGR